MECVFLSLESLIIILKSFNQIVSDNGVILLDVAIILKQVMCIMQNCAGEWEAEMCCFPLPVNQPFTTLDSV